MLRLRLTASPRHAHGCAAGFTLIELLVVLSIVAALMAVMLPRFDRARMEVDSQSTALRSVMLTAQRQAITRGYDVVVVFDEGARLVRVQEDPNGNMKEDPGERSTAMQLEGQVRFGRADALPLRAQATAAIGFKGRQGALPAVVFHRDGSAGEPGVFYLTTSRALAGGHSSDSRAFDLVRGTGRVVAYRYSGASWARE